MLVRYDGSEWKLFSNENSPIPERDITALSNDKQGTVWLGTHDGHIVKFDGAKWDMYKADYKSPIGPTMRDIPREHPF